MKKYYCRKIDELGRVVIPKELRDHLGLRVGESVELWEEDGKLLLTPEAQHCRLCGGKEDLMMVDGEPICHHCVEKVKAI